MVLFLWLLLLLLMLQHLYLLSEALNHLDLGLDLAGAHQLAAAGGEAAEDGGELDKHSGMG